MKLIKQLIIGGLILCLPLMVSAKDLDFDANPTFETVETSGDIYTVPWTDYSSTSTVTGWSAVSTYIRYKKIGKIVFVIFDIGGTSNSTAVTFTLPYTAVNTDIDFQGALGLAQNNNSIVTVASRYVLSKNTATVTCYTNMSNGSWANSGSKAVKGMFWYEVQ